MTAKRQSPTRARTPSKAGDEAGPIASARQGWVAMGLLAVAVSVAYANSLKGPFIFDDGPSIESNPSIRSLTFPEVLLAPPEAVTTTGRPIVNLSLALNYALGGLAVEGYHAVNLALHVLAALVLLALVRRTLLLPRLAPRFGSSATGLALSVALLWAVHPLQTESVTYVVQRAEVLVGLFYFLTLYCFLRGATTARAKPWYAAAVVACALGMASKEVMATAPLLAILFDRTFVAGSFRRSLRQRWVLWLGLAVPWVLLAILYGTSGSRGGSAGFGTGVTSWQYARTQFGCIIRYLGLAVWPDPLVLDYGQRLANSAGEIVPYAVVVLALVVATVVGLVRRPSWGFLGAWFFAILAPSSSIVPLATQTQAEHRMYLPLVGVVALVVFASYLAMARMASRSRWATTLVLVVASALGSRTHLRNRDYQTELGIWNANIRDCPENHRAYLTRGSVYWTMGRYDEALRDYDRCIELSPRNAKAHVGRGNVFDDRRQHDLALRDFEKAIALDPKLADAYDGRGGVMLKRGQIDQALRDFDRAIALDPQLANAYLHRADAHHARREMDAAIRDYGMVIRLRPDFAQAYSNRCNALMMKGQVDAALEDCDRAIALRPDLVAAYNTRGNVMQSKRRYAEAIGNYDQAIALNPDFAVAYQNRAIAHAKTGDHDKAWADVRMCRSLGATPNPSFIEELTRISGRAE